NAAGDTTLLVSLPGDEIVRSQPAALRTLGRRLDVIPPLREGHLTTRFVVCRGWRFVPWRGLRAL
ncbi:MAG TPA: hypothetical protein VFJ76_03245, partial [Solirubrobacterales bacterium]|nr:hypothetical protein [Solirubrobacterales bacterium]